MYVSNTHCII